LLPFHRTLALNTMFDGLSSLRSPRLVERRAGWGTQSNAKQLDKNLCGMPHHLIGECANRQPSMCWKRCSPKTCKRTMAAFSWCLRMLIFLTNGYRSHQTGICIYLSSCGCENFFCPLFPFKTSSKTLRQRTMADFRLN